MSTVRDLKPSNLEKKISLETARKMKIKVESVGKALNKEEAETEFAKMQGMYAIKHFVNTKSAAKGSPYYRSCVVAVVVNETILFGISEIGSKEKSYRKKLGVKIAKGRAYKTPCKTVKIIDPFKINERYLNDMIKSKFKTCYDVARAMHNQKGVKQDIKADARLRQKTDIISSTLRKMNVKHKEEVLKIYNELKKLVNEDVRVK